jgi:hypothetical protein
MKTLLKLAVLAVTSTAALALAGNALAVQKLSVSQTASSLTIKVSQAQSDAQPAKITIYVPTGYSINSSAAPGTKIGTTSGSVFARDANIPLPLSGDVIVAPPNTNAPGCATGTHLAVWLLALSVAGQNINLPVHVDQTSGTEAALGAYKLVVCLAPADVPQGTPGRSPNGAQLLEAVFTTNNIFTVPAGASVWKAITTPYAPGLPAPNVAGTVETRALVGPGTVSLTGKANAKKREVQLTGRVAQSGAAVAGAQVRLLINGKLTTLSKRTTSAGTYSMKLRRKPGFKKATSIFQTRVTVGDRDVTATGCSSPTPGVPGGCVSATASAFTAVSPKFKVRI